MTQSLINTLLVLISLINNLTVNYAKGEIINYQNPVIEINKINLSQTFYPFNKEKNNVDKGVQTITDFDPEKENHNIVLASHSGSAKISYFKRLDELKPKDQINIYYKQNKYTYIINDIYDVEKTGYVQIKRDKRRKTLTLVTCRKGTNKQIVVIAYRK